MGDFIIDEDNIPPCLEMDENTVLWRYMPFSSLCEILMYNLKCHPLFGPLFRKVKRRFVEIP